MLSKMSAILTQRMFANEQKELAVAHALLSRVDPAKELVVIWYVQWT